MALRPKFSYTFSIDLRGKFSSHLKWPFVVIKWKAVLYSILYFILVHMLFTLEARQHHPQWFWPCRKQFAKLWVLISHKRRKSLIFYWSAANLCICAQQINQLISINCSKRSISSRRGALRLRFQLWASDRFRSPSQNLFAACTLCN